MLCSHPERIGCREVCGVLGCADLGQGVSADDEDVAGLKGVAKAAAKQQRVEEEDRSVSAVQEPDQDTETVGEEVEVGDDAGEEEAKTMESKNSSTLTLAQVDINTVTDEVLSDNFSEQVNPYLINIKLHARNAW